MPETLHLLSYDYVADILERRAPHREAHLAAISAFHRAGRIVMAGAVGDPVAGGLFVLRDAADAAAFMAEDPYVAAGLVTAHRVEPWTVVTPV
ncbi:YciI family protein [Conexibacter woesei]|uniref:YCII-related protein n=1 Tax=Conexibacter woesei (strain DSM 14684 / CCUG 47730 / CIP 108061 / JCM 11494 / NBRC 100937 / ID131577) TaxID=469383 RepID=D3FC25_CONWI|nr:YciI family protein [Conexibacter woesei]ADB53320.1 YCII-related protein [Conexibacter woesei DSM 14684]